MLSQTTLALATSVALAALFATEAANAQAYAQRCEVHNAQANPNYGFGPCVTVQPGDVGLRKPSDSVRSRSIRSQSASAEIRLPTPRMISLRSRTSPASMRVPNTDRTELVS
jgi:hypothetical protein